MIHLYISDNIVITETVIYSYNTFVVFMLAKEGVIRPSCGDTEWGITRCGHATPSC